MNRLKIVFIDTKNILSNHKVLKHTVYRKRRKLRKPLLRNTKIGSRLNFVSDNLLSPIIFIYLFGVLRRFQHCTGHIMTGSSKGRGNQYIQFIRVLYCKLPINGKQLPAFPLEAVPGIEPRPQRWEVSVTTLPPWPPFPCNSSDVRKFHNDLCSTF